MFSLSWSKFIGCIFYWIHFDSMDSFARQSVNSVTNLDSLSHTLTIKINLWHFRWAQLYTRRVNHQAKSINWICGLCASKTAIKYSTVRFYSKYSHTQYSERVDKIVFKFNGYLFSNRWSTRCYRRIGACKQNRFSRKGSITINSNFTHKTHTRNLMSSWMWKFSTWFYADFSMFTFFLQLSEIQRMLYVNCFVHDFNWMRKLWKKLVFFRNHIFSFKLKTSNGYAYTRSKSRAKWLLIHNDIDWHKRRLFLSILKSSFL